MFTDSDLQAVVEGADWRGGGLALGAATFGAGLLSAVDDGAAWAGRAGHQSCAGAGAVALHGATDANGFRGGRRPIAEVSVGRSTIPASRMRFRIRMCRSFLLDRGRNAIGLWLKKAVNSPWFLIATPSEKCLLSHIQMSSQRLMTK